MTDPTPRILDVDQHDYEPFDCCTRHLERATRDHALHVAVNAEAILDSALALAEERCELPPFGLLARKQGMSGETREAASAFFEKRKPRWSDRG